MLTRRGLLIAAPALLLRPAHAQFNQCKPGPCNSVAANITIDPYWNNVKLLIGFNNSFADESSVNHGIPVYGGSPVIRTDQSVFNGQSGYFNGSSTISFPPSNDWNFSTRKFTIEFWYRQSSTGLDNLIGQWASTVGDNAWLISTSNILGLNISSTGSNTIAANTGTIMAANIWYPVCTEYDGTTYRLYVNGAVQAKTVASVNIHASSLNLVFGGGSGNKPYTGYIDEFRLTMDVARYASDSGYTVPTQPFPRG